MKTIAFLAVFVALFTVGFPASKQAFAAECKKYEYTSPAGVKILGTEEIRVAISGNTADAWATNQYQLYFNPNGEYVVEIRGRITQGKWKICDHVLVMESNVILERVLAFAEAERLSFYGLEGTLRSTATMKKGKTF